MTAEPNPPAPSWLSTPDNAASLDQPTGQAPQHGSPIGSAIKRHTILIVFLCIALCAAGVAVGVFVRSPEYSAKAELSVGQADLATQSTQGYAQAVQNLASVYSRLVKSSTVVEQVAKETGRTPQDVAGHVTASATPSSSVFYVKTTGDSKAEALKLNRTTVDATQAYIVKLGNNGQADAESAFARFKSATAKSAALRQRIAHLEALRDAGKATPSQKELADLNARANTYDLIAQTYGDQYQTSSQPTNKQFKGADIVNRPFSASSDTSSWAQRLGAAGLLFGVLLGVAIALLIEGRRRHRATR